MIKKLILAAYIIYLPFQLKLPQIPLVNTLNLFLILLTLIFISGRNKYTKKSGFEVPLFIFLIIWTISFVHALFNPLGIWKYEIFILFKRLITLVLGYFVFSRCLKSKKELNFMFYIFLLTLVLVGISTARGGMLAGQHFADFKRSSGPFGEGFRGSDIAGGFLAMFSPFALSFALLTRNKILKISGIAGLIICATGMLTTYSRGSMLALGIALLISSLFSIKTLLKTSKISVVVIIITLLGLIINWERWVPDSIIHRVDETIQEDNSLYAEQKLDESSKSRFSKWNAGFEIFATNPLVGVGFKIPEYMFSTDTHNAFIQMLAEMGIFAILSLVWFLWRILQESIKLSNTDFSYIGIGFIGCITAFLVVNMFYSNFFRDTVVGSFWVALGMLSSSKNFVGKDVKQRI